MAEPPSLLPRPQLVLLVERFDLDDPWLAWVHACLVEHAQLVVQAVTTGSRESTRGWSAFARLVRGIGNGLEWPDCPAIIAADEELRAAQATADEPVIVLNLTSTAHLPADLQACEHWWLRVAGRRLAPGNRRLGFDDVERAAPITEVVLVSDRTDADKSVVLASTVHDTRWSGDLNRRVVLGKVPTVLVKGLARWRRGKRLSDDAVASSSLDSVTSPGESLFEQTVRRVRREWQQRLHNLQRRSGRRPGMWSLYVGRGDVLAASLAETVELRPEANDYWADPFLWRRDGRVFIFYEAYDYRTMRGRIAVGELSEDNSFSVIGDVLSPAHHLSYPFLIEYEGELLMIPECSGLGRIEIFRCTDFPSRFERVATRLEGHAIVDLTLFCRDEQWWLFCAMAVPGVEDTNGALFAFAVDSPLLASIVPHACNPIVTDSRFARPGGRVFEQDGVWYRPSQDNSHGVYGHGLNLMEIRVLSLDDYEEVPVRSFDAGFAHGLVGVHHLDQSEELFIVDGCHALGGRPSRRARQA